MKPRRHILPLCLLSATLFLPSTSGAQNPLSQTLNLKFTSSMPKGGCVIGFAGGNAPGTDKPMKLEFSYRVRDGNFGATVKVNGWPKAQQENRDRNVPLTLIFDNGQKTTSRSGGYDIGFNDMLWSGWGPGEGSDTAYAMLKDAKSARVEADGMDLGEFDFQLKGFPYHWIQECSGKQRARGS